MSDWEEQEFHGKITTYPAMNEKIVSLLRINNAYAPGLYAAQRIEELEKWLVAAEQTLEELIEIIQKCLLQSEYCEQTRRSVNSRQNAGKG